MSFITEDDFAEMCDFCFTRRIKTLQHIDLSKIEKGSLIGLTGETYIMNVFFDIILPKINTKIILIIIETDETIPQNINWLNNPKIFHIFSWNIGFKNPKLTCIPIGINKMRQEDGLIKYLLNKKRYIDNKKLLLSNFSINTNKKEREYTWNLGQKWNFCDNINMIPPLNIQKNGVIGDITNNTYYELLDKYKFVLSPPGTGYDCHRTWEGLYIGTYPIVKSTPIDEIYEGLPILVVKDFKEITEELLHIKYEEFNKMNKDRCYMEYWKNIILMKKNECLLD